MLRPALRRVTPAVALALAAAATPGVARACAMCKSSIEDPAARRLATGYLVSILSMLGVVSTLVVVGGALIVHRLDPTAGPRLIARLRRLERRRTALALAAALILFGWAALFVRAQSMPPPPTETLPLEALAPRPRVDPAGGKAALGRDALEGRAVVVAFIASWCQPCRAQVADLERLAAEYGADVTVVAVSIFESNPDLPAERHVHDDGEVHYHRAPPPEQTLAEWLAADGVTVPVVPASRALVTGFGQIARVPTTFVFAPDGRRVAYYQNHPVEPFVRPPLDVLRADVAAALGRAVAED